MVAVVVEQVFPPGLAVTRYPVIAAPPEFADAVQDTTDRAFAFDVAETPVGASGTVETSAEAEGTEAGDVPLAFVAVTVKV